MSVLVAVVSSCSHGSLTWINGNYAIRITDPVITIDSSGTAWISNADKTYRYMLSMSRRDIVDISKCAESDGDSTTYIVRRPYRNKKYMAHISYDFSSFPYTHSHINYENYSARYIVELYQPYNIRSLYRDIVSCKNLFPPMRFALNEMFTPARKNKLPEKIITRFDMEHIHYFVRTNKDGSQIIIPYCLMVTCDEINNIDDIVFPPVQLQDSLFLTIRHDKMSFGYPVFINNSIDMEKDYILELTMDESKTYEYKGLLKKRI